MATTAILNAADTLLSLFAFKKHDDSAVPATLMRTAVTPTHTTSNYRLRHRASRRRSPRLAGKRAVGVGSNLTKQSGVIVVQKKHTVDRLVRRRYVDGNQVLYLVKWVDGTQTWEPRRLLAKDVPAMVRTYELGH